MGHDPAGGGKLERLDGRIGLLSGEHAAYDPAVEFRQLSIPKSWSSAPSALSERLLAQVSDGAIDVAAVHQIPVLAAGDAVEWERLWIGRLAILVSRSKALAARESVALEDLSGETFVVNPERLAPSAFLGMKLMCRTYGGFEPKMLESPFSALPAAVGWQPIIDGEGIAVFPEGAARAAQHSGVVAVPIQPPPNCVICLAWRRGRRSPLLDRCLEFIRAYRDEHAWMDGGATQRPELT